MKKFGVLTKRTFYRRVEEARSKVRKINEKIGYVSPDVEQKAEEQQQCACDTGIISSDSSTSSSSSDSPDSFDSSSDSCNEDWSEKTQFNARAKVRDWALKHNVTNNSLSDILIIFNECGIVLPKDARTILNTPRKIEVFPVPPGHYHHFNLRHILETICLDLGHKCPQALEIFINIDGLPISNSSFGQLWPILGRVAGLNMEPFVIGVYYGHEKPENNNTYLNTFIVETNDLLSNGIDINGNHYAILLKAIICDAPARAFTRGIKGHAGYSSCEKCVVEGEYHYASGHVVLDKMNAKLRTDASFRSREDYGHHTMDSPFEQLPIDMIKQFPLDYQHLICLGVMKRLLQNWLSGKTEYKTKFTPADIANISVQLRQCGKTLPNEYQRAIRDLKSL